MMRVRRITQPGNFLPFPCGVPAQCTGEIVGGSQAATRVVEEIELETSRSDPKRFAVSILDELLRGAGDLDRNFHVFRINPHFWYH